MLDAKNEHAVEMRSNTVVRGVRRLGSRVVIKWINGYSEEELYLYFSTLMSKKSFTEQDICSKFITPAIVEAGWDLHRQIREQYSFTKGRIKINGKTIAR